jgi:hypothetical protein
MLDTPETKRDRAASVGEGSVGRRGRRSPKRVQPPGCARGPVACSAFLMDAVRRSVNQLRTPAPPAAAGQAAGERFTTFTTLVPPRRGGSSDDPRPALPCRCTGGALRAARAGCGCATGLLGPVVAERATLVSYPAALPLAVYPGAGTGAAEYAQQRPCDRFVTGSAWPPTPLVLPSGYARVRTRLFCWT